MRPKRKPLKRKFILKKDASILIKGPRGRFLFEGNDRRVPPADRRKSATGGFRELREEDKGRIIKQEWLDEAQKKFENSPTGFGVVVKKRGKITYNVAFYAREKKFYWNSDRRKRLGEYDWVIEK